MDRAGYEREGGKVVWSGVASWSVVCASVCDDLVCTCVIACVMISYALVLEKYYTRLVWLEGPQGESGQAYIPSFSDPILLCLWQDVRNQYIPYSDTA